MKEFFKRRIISYGIAVVAVALVHIFIKNKYGYLFAVNDDIFYRALINGTLTGECEARLIYISNVLGFFLKGLYSICGTVEWYSLFLIFSHYLTWILLAGEIGSLTNTIWQKCISSATVLLICLIVDLERVVMSTFTSTAACFGAVGLIFLALFLFNDKAIGYGVLTVVCCVLSFLTRHEVFYSFLPLLGIIVELFLGVSHKKIIECIKLIFPYILALGIAFGAIYTCESISYSASEWKEYLAFNDARTVAHDYCGVPEFERNKEAYSNIGWDYDDFYMMKYAGPGIFDDLDSTKMSKYANIASAEYKWQLQWKKNAVIRFLEDYWSVENSALKMIALTMCISLCVFFVFNKNAKGLISVILGGLYHVMYGSLLIYKGRFPERINHVILLGIIAFYFSLYIVHDRVLNKQAEVDNTDDRLLTGVKAVALLICVGLCFLLSRDNMNDSYKTVINRVSNLILLREYCNNNPENVYCIEGSIYGAYSDYAFGEGNPNNLIVVGSWLPKSPHHKAWSNRLEIDTVSTGLVNSENVYLIRQIEEPDDIIVDFYNDLNVNVNTEIVDIFPGGTVKVVRINAGK